MSHLNVKQSVSISKTISKRAQFFLLLALVCFTSGSFSKDALAQRANKQIKETPFVTDILAEKPTSLGLPEKIEIITFPKMSFGEGNKYFNNITTIQYQISLLNVLVERQRKNKEIQTAMNNIGIVYKEPAPSKSTCLELPKNKLCEKFFPEIYGMTAQPVVMPTLEVSFQDFINQRTLPDTKESVARREPSKPKAIAYLWTDITCVFDTCRAVLIPENGGSRFSVRIGDLVGSKHTVENIRMGKVSLIEKSTGNKIELRPAPSSATGGSASPFITSNVGQVFAVPSVDSENVDALIDTLKSDKEIQIVQ